MSDNKAEASSMAESTLNQFIDASTAGNSTTLEFISSELGQEVTLLLMFEPPKVGKLYVDLYPVCWKVLSFSATGISSASVEYTASGGFFVPQMQTGHRVLASNAQHCQLGEQCTFKTNENASGNYLTSAIAGTKGVMQCTNATRRPGSAGIGSFNDVWTRIEPTVLWDNVAIDSTLPVTPNHTLKIYALSGYIAGELIRADVESPPLFEKNIIKDIPAFTGWKLFINGVGHAQIDSAW